MDDDEFKTQVISLLTRIACVLETRQSSAPARAASPKPKAAASSKPARRSSTNDEVTVGDMVGDTGDWGDVQMPFGKHKGKPLRNVPVGFMQWLGPKWEPKGYDNDDAMQSCFAAVLSVKDGGSRSEPEEPTNAPAPPTVMLPPDDPCGDDVPF